MQAYGSRVLLYPSSQWTGPYEVVEVNKVNATIKKGHMLIKVPMNRLKPFY